MTLNASQVASVQQAAVIYGAKLSPPVTPAEVTVSNGTDADGSPTVSVTVSYPWTPEMALVGPINLSRTAVPLMSY